MLKLLTLSLIALSCLFITFNAEEAKPTKKPTEEQRAKVKVGDFVTYAFTTKSTPLSNLDSEYQVKYSVIEIKDDTYKLLTEVVKDTLPGGISIQRETINQIANITEIPNFYLNKKVGETKNEGSIGIVFRDTDKQITISNSKLICKNFKITWDIPNGHAKELIWLCPPEIPITVKLKTKTEHNLIVKGKRIKIVQKEELVAWRRIK